MTTRRVGRTPPGPRGQWLLGSLVDYTRDPFGFLLRCAREYGDVVRLTFLQHPIYVIYHPDAIEQVLVREHHRVIKAVEYRRELDFLGNGLLVSEGAFWLRQRRLAQPAFHRTRIDAYGTVIVDAAEGLHARWRDGDTLDLHHAMMGLTLEIVAKTLFAADIGTTAEAIGAALDTIMQHAADTEQHLWKQFIPRALPTPSKRRRTRAIARLDTIIYDLIRDRRASGTDAGDLLSMLMAAQDDDDTHLTDQQLRDEALTLLLAGHETTALTLAWAWYLLAQHPTVEMNLHAEVDAVLGERAPTTADLPRLGYTTQIVKETMRLYPPAWSIGRQTVEAVEIGGYTIPAGAQVYMVQYVTQRDARFFPDPDAFNPDRWADAVERQVPRFAYFPFGGGPRLCIGANFAMLEAVLLLATIAQRWRFTLAPDQHVTLLPSITLRPKDGIRMVVSQREGTHEPMDAHESSPA